MKARRERTEPPRSIFVLKPSSFGDIIHALPAVARLRDRWPASRISWLVNTEWSPLLHGNGLVDEIVPFPRQQLRGWRGLWRLPAWLRANIAGRRPDLTLDYQGLLRTAFIGRSAGSRYFAGLADAREGAGWLYDATAPTPPGVPHAVERYLALSDMVINEGTDSGAPGCANEELRFPLPDGEPIAEPMQAAGRFILLHPFARGEGKSLDVRQIQTICSALAPTQVVVVGSTMAANLNLSANSLDLSNRTSLARLLWLVQRASFVISVDSGPAHLAAALGKPMVAIHTWSDPRRVGPYLPTAWVLKNGELLRVDTLSERPEAFYAQRPGEVLPVRQMEAICALAISS